MNKPAIAVHAACGTYGLEFAKLAGVIESTVPGLTIADSNLYFDPQNILQLSAYLFTTVPFWPDRSIFLSMVGSGRAIAVELPNGSILIGPDNGFITMTVEHFGFKAAYAIEPQEFGNDEWMLGRCAAFLANGMPIAECGEKLELEDLFIFHIPKARISEGRAEGEVGMLLMTFGNITFTIGTDEFEGTGIRHGDHVKVTFTKDGNVEYCETMTYQPSFGYVEKGAPVVFNGSSGYMDIGLNMESFIQTCIPQIVSCENPGDYKVVIEKTEEE